MNSGIICDALTTILALELEYLGPTIFREIGTGSDRPTELQHSKRLFEDEFTSLLGVCEKEMRSRE